ncbi:MAG: bifunctional phosphopantothenoylcysteine decarboxylase/phosphopantothenate--cysteine ligase CoaBC [Rhodospirillaceae bacterium]|jgi:phosphopantothenoylcysteine decarboxylase / phosphopantothenate---cysteine ligase|nr:bifunctional phosphopantothenoylcysteine decarboxylase/phosphopantothenate--cysteine ligase CoaBC [Rhodospirillaceae bacterium]MBT4940887.1 bifunctional phosphopantothenoylcysteine decarboxylase/phosphopantothenate--cysteine ligase CoaBC [Rhodospirillaceae bacterium]MBT5939802.1 bifunctional phosphopantothenoylcysteine decarboxylase/phosphopantothenate--cysteine ligase CoaBC [Rhodospirillaceae bacterium]MBT7266027.1 bifunctional phosphopantothenoylcysteine decarboxylase/phosphopantothenate--c
MVSGKRVLLIIAGGIAAFKSLELIRNLRRRDIAVRCILTQAGSQFVTPLSLAALTEDKVYQDLFSLTDESEMGHIELSRDADLVVVAPATANILAKMRAGIADDLATTALLATDKPVYVAPAMNVRMWEHAASQDNIAVLQERGVKIIGPEEGDMACGEYGLGRMSEPETIAEAIENFFLEAGQPNTKSLIGKKAIVTSGPTHEAIDPVRYLANHSSGRQGHAIAKALAAEGAETVLVSGPTQLPDPGGVTVKHVQSAEDMLAACQAALPADIVVCAAAVADWRIDNPPLEKIKKNGSLPSLNLVENPDILAHLSQIDKNRPELVIGFAAETEDVVTYAQAKLAKKGCDWIVANDVSPETGTFGGTNNTVHVISGDGVEDWPTLSKEDVGRKLTTRIVNFLETPSK